MNPMSVFETLSGALVGLCLGSFLNVVIHRLPLRMARQEEEALHEVLQARGHDLTLPPLDHQAATGHSLWRASRCPHCHHRLWWRHNIPLLGFALLRGRCAHCAQPIAWRYPLVELLAGVWLAFCCARWGVSAQALALGGAGLCLLALAAIDAEHLLLPDALTLPMVWAGLLCATGGWHGVALADAVWGAALGYSLLAGAAWVFFRITGKEGLGGGDFKLFAALGAWQGWMALPWVLLIACIGSLAWLAWRSRQAGFQQGHYPFGPWLALGGIVQWLMA